MKLIQHFIIGTTIASLALPLPAIASDTIVVDPAFARERVLTVKVTPMGLAVNFNQAIASVNLSHKRNFVVSALDGMLCQSTVQCPEDGSPPTKLLLRKIKPIDFKDETQTPQGKAMLFVTTKTGQVYRLELEPSNGTPPYTLVEYSR